MRATDLTHAEFLFRYMGVIDDTRKPYTLDKGNGKVMLQRNGSSFGTHDKNMVLVVWNFLEKHKWDKGYSTKGSGLKGKHYCDWLYSQIKEEEDKINLQLQEI